MKIVPTPTCLIAALLLGGNPTFAQSNVYSLYIVGYVNTIFQAGDTLFGNPLQNTDSLLSTIIPSAPDGATVSLWSPNANAYAQSSIYASGAWSTDFSLNPGEGARLTTSTLFTNTFVGYVLAPGGLIVTNEADILIPPMAFTGPPGHYLLSCKTPLSLEGALPVFTYVLGRDPVEGEQFTALDSLTQTYHTTTFAGGAWDHGDPVLSVGEAAFFNVVPEPSAGGLVILGLCLAGVGHRWRSGRHQR
jgi:hypothetical protein